ncbi:C39 family peptidase [Micromonospora inositola]|uniref:Peptidase_C39 like family protein n=1 Tax=Micromonospora inositola TaxID=47865 RepID=A0A1C5JR66_9ACTN|nr:C39 family peptidase [Micromonospora inositola]SCG72516.1 Peptidase_C39 like family protein [Micromonospora inositola]
MNSIFRRSALSVAGLMVTGGAIAGPAIAAPAASAASEPAAVLPGAPPAQGKRVLEYDYQRQPNSYYCAPAATRIALSTQGKVLSQSEVAKKLGTTKAGTNSADDTTRVLNEVTGGGYQTTDIGGPKATPEQVDKLRVDVVQAVDAKRGVVANITGIAVDTDGNAHSYPTGHYLSIVGYRDGGDTVKIADPYDSDSRYWMNDEKVADWVAERGYSS